MALEACWIPHPISYYYDIGNSSPIVFILKICFFLFPIQAICLFQLKVQTLCLISGLVEVRGMADPYEPMPKLLTLQDCFLDFIDSSGSESPQDLSAQWRSNAASVAPFRSTEAGLFRGGSSTGRPQL